MIDHILPKEYTPVPFFGQPMNSLIDNKRTRYRYLVLETWEVGIVLTGQEVKSVKGGHGDLKNAYVTVRVLPSMGKGGARGRIRMAAFLVNAHIPPYRKAGPLPGYDPDRSRQLLFHRQQLQALLGKLQQAGLTLIPLKVYIQNRRVKLLVGLARGKTAIDKRATIREREVKRELRSRLKVNHGRGRAAL